MEGILLSSVLRSLKKTEKQSALEALFAPQKQKSVFARGGPPCEYRTGNIP